MRDKFSKSVEAFIHHPGSGAGRIQIRRRKNIPGCVCSLPGY
jgi:hypothetical protein